LVKMDAGRQDTVTEVIAGIAATLTVAEPYFAESWVDVAVMVAVPAPLGVKTPDVLTTPAFVGLTDQVTAELKAPVPLTVGVHAAV